MSRPVYKPKGFYKSTGEFMPKSFYGAVLQSSPFTQGTHATLMAICHAADLREPFAIVAKKTIMQLSKAQHMPHVITHLKKLREAGMIVTLSGQVGGKGVFPKYEIHLYGDAGIAEPEPEEVQAGAITEVDQITLAKIKDKQSRGEPIPSWLIGCLSKELQNQYN